jgi:hypothetical protein
MDRIVKAWELDDTIREVQRARSNRRLRAGRDFARCWLDLRAHIARRLTSLGLAASRGMSLLASVTGDMDELAEEGHALCCMPPRERAVPSLRACEDLYSGQVRSAVCDRVSDVDPRIESTRDVGWAARPGQIHRRPAPTGIVPQQAQQPADFASPRSAEPRDLTFSKSDESSVRREQSCVLDVIALPDGVGPVDRDQMLADVGLEPSLPCCDRKHDHRTVQGEVP